MTGIAACAASPFSLIARLLRYPDYAFESFGMNFSATPLLQ